MSFSIVELEPDNGHVLNNVAEDVFDYAIDPDLLETYLSQSTHKMFIAVIDDIVVGQVRGIIHFQPDEPAHLYIDNLGVAPTAKRQGIASALFNALIEWGQHNECKGYWVATECDNDEGNGFYESLGLTPQQMYFYEGEN